MDSLLLRRYEEVVQAGASILLIENKNWPNYVISEFATLRASINALQKRKGEIDKEVSEILHGVK